MCLTCSSEVLPLVVMYNPPPRPDGAVQSVNAVFISSVPSMLSLALSPSDTYNAPPFPDVELQRVNMVCLDEELVIEIVCDDLRSAFNTAPFSPSVTLTFSNVDPSMVSDADCVSVIRDFDRLIDPSLVDGWIEMEVSVSVPADASNRDPVIILFSSVVRVKVSEVNETEMSAVTTNRELPSSNLLTALEAAT